MSKHWIKPEEIVELAGLDGPPTEEFLSKLWHYFCWPNKREGRCKECWQCQASLQRIFQPLEDVQDPVAVLVWRCRDTVAQLEEDEHRHVAQPVLDKWGFPAGDIDHNPFEAFLQWVYAERAKDEPVGTPAQD